MTGSDVVGEQVIRLRKLAGLTREQLAVRCTELGWPALTFGAISSIETGRRDKDTGRRRRHITIEERDVLAAALGVPPALLEAPLGSTEPVEAMSATVQGMRIRWVGRSVERIRTVSADCERDPN